MFGEMLCANSEMFVEHFEVKAEKRPGRLLNKFPAKVKRLDKIFPFVSSVRSSSGYHGLLEGSAATFSDFSNSSDSKVKVKVKGPNMCYIFEKHWIQGYRI